MLPKYMHLLIGTSYLPRLTYLLCKYYKKNQIHLVQYVKRKFMEVDYNMLV